MLFKFVGRWVLGKEWKWLQLLGALCAANGLTADALVGLLLDALQLVLGSHLLGERVSGQTGLVGLIHQVLLQTAVDDARFASDLLLLLPELHQVLLLLFVVS